MGSDPRTDILNIVSIARGQWTVRTAAAGMSVIPYTLPDKKAATAARAVIMNAFPAFPWESDADTLKAAVREFRSGNGDTMRSAVMRALAADPAADPDGAARVATTATDTVRQERARCAAQEDRDGFTETVELNEIGVGDIISFRYTVTHDRPGFEGMRPMKGRRGSAHGVQIRGTVTAPGRAMTHGGNNSDEGRSGLRFPLADATWTDRDGLTGALSAAVTVGWADSVRRLPRPASA